MKISEIILLLERDGWKLKRVSGSTGTLLTRQNLGWLPWRASRAPP
jgi:predicted RNA binding protein YcfA (HicA-like mRNA interferase family)